MQRRRTPEHPLRRGAQRGVLAAALGLLMVPLLGFVAMVVDVGRLYINKTEMQNAADSCALAAAAQLTQAVLPSNAFTRADTAGLLLARTFYVDFGRTQLRPTDIRVEFNENQTGGTWSTWSATPAPSGNARFARCTIQRENVDTWFLKFFNKQLFTVSAQAVARIQAAGSNNCGLPTGPASHCGATSSLYQ